MATTMSTGSLPPLLAQRTGIADGAIGANRLVRHGSADGRYAQASTVTDRIAGVLLGLGPAAAGDPIAIGVLGECPLAVAGTIEAGMTLTTDADGRGVNASPPGNQNNRVVGFALASGTDTVVPVLLLPGWVQG